ncbi:hypothetical protein FV185_12470 [Ferrovum sp. PN-J185]|nr:hypothetical protein FV185_12470 [Ferrovum sp. PN-J185]
MQIDNEKLFDTINALVDNASLIYQIYNEGPIIFLPILKSTNQLIN